MFFLVRFALSQGAGMAEGSNWCRLYHHSGFNQCVRHIDCNMPLLSTKEKPQWFVLSGVVRFIPDYDWCVFLSAVFRCWHGKGRNDRRIVQVFSHLWILMTNIWLYLTNCRAVSLYKLRKFFGKCKWGLDSSGRQSKRRRVSLPASTTKSTSSNETKTFMTSNYIAKLVFNSHLHKINKPTREKVVKNQPPYQSR